MHEIPFDARIDKANGVIDGRDLAVKCMMHAYELLGPYADDREDYFEKLIDATHRIARDKLAERLRQAGLGPIPKCRLVIDGDDRKRAEMKFKRHLAGTAQITADMIWKGADPTL